MGLKVNHRGLGAFAPIGGHAHPGWHPDNIGTLNLIASFPPGIFNFIVYQTTWDEVENVQGVYDFSRLATFLTALRAYNTLNNANPLGVRIRLWAGSNAAAYQLALSSLVIDDGQGNMQTVSKYWSQNYLKNFFAMWDAFGDYCDPIPEIISAASSAPASGTDEQFNEGKNSYDIESAGRTDAVRQGSFTNADHGVNVRVATHWPSEYIEYTISPSVLMDGSTPGHDVRVLSFATTIDQMQDIVKRVGPAPITFSNHGLNLASPNINIWQSFVLGGSGSLQMGNSTDNTLDTVLLGIQYAQMIELFPGWETLPASTLQAMAAAFNVPVVPWHWHWATTT